MTSFLLTRYFEFMFVGSVLGTQFYLMDYVRGRLFKNAALPGMEPSERKVCLRVFVRSSINEGSI